MPISNVLRRAGVQARSAGHVPTLWARTSRANFRHGTCVWAKPCSTHCAALRRKLRNTRDTLVEFCDSLDCLCFRPAHRSSRAFASGTRHPTRDLMPKQCVAIGRWGSTFTARRTLASTRARMNRTRFSRRIDSRSISSRRVMATKTCTSRVALPNPRNSDP
jgi:hypothetical protein